MAAIRFAANICLYQNLDHYRRYVNWCGGYIAYIFKIMVLFRTWESKPRHFCKHIFPAHSGRAGR